MSEVLKYKLENFQAEPSARVWDAIATRLDEEQPQLREKLRAFSTEPPASTWLSISKKLDHPATVLPIQKNKPRVFKYTMVAAAVILTVIVISVLYTYRGKNDIALDGTVRPANGSIIPNDSNKQQTAIIPDTGKGGIPDNQVAAVPDQPEKGARYLTVAHDDGTKVRLSKKVYPVINCAEQTGTAWSKCKENIQALQEKMATSMSAASTDFGGLMDMLKDLEENRK
jgi:hypothetical protein